MATSFDCYEDNTTDLSFQIKLTGKTPIFLKINHFFSCALGCARW